MRMSIKGVLSWTGTALFISIGLANAQTISQHCRTGTSCYTSDGIRTCIDTTHCWFTLEQGLTRYTDPDGSASGIGLPQTLFDTQPDATMDCWKGLTTDARLTSGFPFRNNGWEPHNGIDVASDSGNFGRGSPIRSIGAGYVSQIGESSANGKFVRVRQGDGMEVTYIHMLDFRMANGANLQLNQKVLVGTQIGRMNCTGDCGGKVGAATRGAIEQTHVHVQVRRLSDGKLMGATDLYGGIDCNAGTGGGGDSGGAGPGGGGGDNCTGTICTDEP